MKRIIAGLLVTAFMLASTATTQAEAAKDDGGGLKGFLTGCCLGTRAAADYNTDGIGDRDFVPWFFVGCCLGGRTQIAYTDGKTVHWREWGRLIPYAGIVFAVWDGVDGAGGETTADFVEKYGSTYY
ncbi:hypothetical protein [Pontiella sulfatireligans]|uniref:Uncharacterized protein n=1 Tax=Pontiella sulfatireligans TaxID=2750658 RepID=A0A6C2UQI3_9BACT|nr:hypothetical protein [Pontiella sulfatireligans]VGO22552.1 hypothetical protein SCARR_04636 [Pontiella sulfatireligans]